MGLHTADGARKYLTVGEREAFLREAERAEREIRTLCMTLAYAGCRLSEALALTIDRVDLTAGALVFESLKKRTTGIYRAVPVPPVPLEALNMVHGIREQQARRGKGRGEKLWPWSRMTGWRVVHAVMQAAGLDGAHASPKGLRHGFGVAAVTAGIPWPRPAHHHGHLCQCRWRRGKGHRPADVGHRSIGMVLLRRAQCNTI
jgi:integrase